MGWTYKAGNGPALAGVLKTVRGEELAACRQRTQAAAHSMRSMDHHFAELFARYEAVGSLRRAA